MKNKSEGNLVNSVRYIKLKILSILLSTTISNLAIGENLFSYKQGHIQFLGFVSYSGLSVKNTTYYSNSSRVAGQYFLFSNLAVDGGYFFMSRPSDGTTILSGLDLGARYFPLYRGTQENLRLDNIKIESYSYFSPYVFFGYRSRTLNVRNTQLGYGGYGGGVGMNLYLGKWNLISLKALERMYLAFELSLDLLELESASPLRVINMTSGIGVAI